MSSEPKRGCGYRVVGGLYLCGGVIDFPCDRLPYPLEYCPTCGAGIHFSRGFQWLNPVKMFDEHYGCQDVLRPCFMCDPSAFVEQSPYYGLLWVGEVYYSPHSFLAEARAMGVSKRIPYIPKELTLGKTVVVLAHKKAITRVVIEGEPPEGLPAIFCAFIPRAVEMPVWESDYRDEKKMKELAKRGITVVPIPDGDLDHHPQARHGLSLDPETGVLSEEAYLD